jgi:hypothetical protein
MLSFQYELLLYAWNATPSATTDSNKFVIFLANDIQLSDAVSVEFAGLNLTDGKANTVKDV